MVLVILAPHRLVCNNLAITSCEDARRESFQYFGYIRRRLSLSNMKQNPEKGSTGDWILYDVRSCHVLKTSHLNHPLVSYRCSHFPVWKSSFYKRIIQESYVIMARCKERYFFYVFVILWQFHFYSHLTWHIKDGQKPKTLQNHQYIVLQPANEIRFFVKLRCRSRTIMLSLQFMRDLICDVNYCAKLWYAS